MLCSSHKIRVMPLTTWHHEPPTSVDDALKKRTDIVLEDVDQYTPHTHAALVALDAYIQAFGHTGAVPSSPSASIKVYVVTDAAGRVLCAEDTWDAAQALVDRNDGWSMQSTRLMLS